MSFLQVLTLACCLCVWTSAKVLVHKADFSCNHNGLPPLKASRWSVFECTTSWVTSTSVLKSLGFPQQREFREAHTLLLWSFTDKCMARVQERVPGSAARACHSEECTLGLHYWFPAIKAGALVNQSVTQPVSQRDTLTDRQLAGCKEGPTLRQRVPTARINETNGEFKKPVSSESLVSLARCKSSF